MGCVSQLTVNGIFRGAAYGLLGVGFALILGVTGRFHFAYSFTYTLAAYMVVLVHRSRRARRSGSRPCSGIARRRRSSASGIERFVYRPLAVRAGRHRPARHLRGVARHRASPARTSSASVLGSSQQILLGARAGAPPPLWEVHFLNFDVWQSVSSAIVLVVLASLLLKFTPLGRSIKATRVNPELARIIGIDAEPAST